MSDNFGEPLKYREGAQFKSRADLAQANIHRPLQAGICGSQETGAESIVLSGGYEDDEDNGDVIIYTGAGGRDSATGVQVEHQKLERVNLALAKNVNDGTPVRVIRGSKHKSKDSPDTGYEYSGLYHVEAFWKEQGAAGFDVWRYKLIKKKLTESLAQVMTQPSRPAPRAEITIQRIIRSSKHASNVKQMYNNQCQVCKSAIKTAAGLYSEAAHIKPLGSPHNGPDDPSNILCLCPNHHVMFDRGGFMIREDYSLLGIDGTLVVDSKHLINASYLSYHRACFENA